MQLELWKIVEKKVLNFKMTAICINKHDSKPIFLSDYITQINQLYLFCHVPGASPKE